MRSRKVRKHGSLRKAASFLGLLGLGLLASQSHPRKTYHSTANALAAPRVATAALAAPTPAESERYLEAAVDRQLAAEVEHEAVVQTNQREALARAKKKEEEQHGMFKVWVDQVSNDVFHRNDGKHMVDAPYTYLTGYQYHAHPTFKPDPNMANRLGFYTKFKEQKTTKKWSDRVKNFCDDGNCTYLDYTSENCLSKNLMDMIKDPSYYDKKNAIESSIPKFPKYALKSLEKYQYGDYDGINHFMRTGETRGEDYANIVRPLLRAFDRSPVIQEDVVAYRGSWGNGCTFEEHQGDLIINNMGFLSTSTNPMTAFTFTNQRDEEAGCFLKINLKGAKALMTNYDRKESEILVAPGTSFKLKSTVFQPKDYYVPVEGVENSPYIPVHEVDVYLNPDIS